MTAEWTPELTLTRSHVTCSHLRQGMLVALGMVTGGLAGWRFGSAGRDVRAVAPTRAPASTEVGTSAIGLIHGGATVEARPKGACASSMQLVEGDYYPTVVHQCLEPFPDGSGRCRRYASGHRAVGEKVTLRFCMDRYEYPNTLGAKPWVMVDYSEAMAVCGKEQKRLCSAREWTLACEGPERLPYPYGSVRDAAACNIDRLHQFPDPQALADPRRQAGELARIDQRVGSGSMPGCLSAFGVYDLTGNVDEWVVPDGSEEAAGANSRTALKGGYYGIVRARCRPTTTAHGPKFKFYQVGFRCCAEPD